MLRAFGHPVVTCFEVLRHVGCCLLKFETGKIFHATFVDVAWCCGRLARFVQQCCVHTSSIFNIQHHVATRCNKDWVANRSQHVAPNNVAICCAETLRLFGRILQMMSQKCYDMLCCNVAIVWLQLMKVWSSNHSIWSAPAPFPWLWCITNLI